MKKAIPKEWVDKIKIENSPKIVVNIFRTVMLSKFYENTNHSFPNFAK
jgi:hypothetical protein